jgi:hypothetical protein
MHESLELARTIPTKARYVELQQQLVVALEPGMNNTTRKREAKVDIVDTKSWAKPSDLYIIDTTDLWESRSITPLPNWMINYFRWHKQQISRGWDITPTDLPNKYLYVTCLKEYHKCGGTADRLLRYVYCLGAEDNANICKYL